MDEGFSLKAFGTKADIRLACRPSGLRRALNLAMAWYDTVPNFPGTSGFGPDWYFAPGMISFLFMSILFSLCTIDNQHL